jgi:hypothetical protein
VAGSGRPDDGDGRRQYQRADRHGAGVEHGYPDDRIGDVE